ncbi:hypothetical protein [Streptomyces sp. NPDC003952]
MTGSSLREFDRLADRIRLHRQADARPILIVEGPSDERILKRSFGDALAYFPAGARGIALSESATLHGWGQKRFLCIVDRDFDDQVEDLEKSGIPIHAYENADLESMLAMSHTAADLLSEFGSIAKIDARGGIEEIARRLCEAVEPLVILRRANVENNWGLAFDSVDLRSKIDKTNLTLKLQSYCAAINATSDEAPGQRILIEFATKQRPLLKTPSCPRGSTPYFRGRDFLAFVSVSLASYCGTRRVDPEILESALRLAGSGHLRQSGWGEELMGSVVVEGIPPGR